MNGSDRRRRWRWTGAFCRLLLPVGLGLLLAGCGEHVSRQTTLTLATTTSTRDSGLLEDLLPVFERQTGIAVKVIAVGTGQALELGRRGDADVLLTHAKLAEETFIQEGHGERRIVVMANDFVLLGPREDPARIDESGDVVSALKAIARVGAPFVSRGDRSGTHIKEEQLWEEAGIAPEGEWYLEAGQGMAGTLRVATNKRAYTLSDRSTYLAHRDSLELEIIVQGDTKLRNEYAVIAVSRRKHPHVKQAAARRFIEFLLSPAARRKIAEFGKEQYGQPLFFPEG